FNRRVRAGRGGLEFNKIFLRLVVVKCYFPVLWTDFNFHTGMLANCGAPFTVCLNYTSLPSGHDPQIDSVKWCPGSIVSDTWWCIDIKGDFDWLGCRDDALISDSSKQGIVVFYPWRVAISDRPSFIPWLVILIQNLRG